METKKPSISGREEDADILTTIRTDSQKESKSKKSDKTVSDKLIEEAEKQSRDNANVLDKASEEQIQPTEPELFSTPTKVAPEFYNPTKARTVFYSLIAFVKAYFPKKVNIENRKIIWEFVRRDTEGDVRMFPPSNMIEAWEMIDIWKKELGRGHENELIKRFRTANALRAKQRKK